MFSFDPPLTFAAELESFFAVELPSLPTEGNGLLSELPLPPSVAISAFNASLNSVGDGADVVGAGTGGGSHKKSR